MREYVCVHEVTSATKENVCTHLHAQDVTAAASLS